MEPILVQFLIGIIVFAGLFAVVMILLPWLEMPAPIIRVARIVLIVIFLVWLIYLLVPLVHRVY